MKRDLAQLYSELGLHPDCTLEEFNRTYRRRIAELHPDKGMHVVSTDPHALPDLLWLYATATRFHRRYGRLPGAVPKRKHEPAVHRSWKSPPHAAAQHSEPRLPMPAGSGSRSDALTRRGLLMALLLLGLLLVLALSWT